MRRALLFVTTIALLGSALAPLGVAAASAKFDKGGNFIVQMAEWPVVAYDGSIKGYKATKPAPGSKINPNASDVIRYVSYLVSRHDAVMKSVGATKKLYDYMYSYNGFSATLTAAQANKLAAAKGVVAVSRDKLYEVDTSSTPHFLGLDEAGDGLWDQAGGVGNAGEDVVIGIIDSGVWPESLSFSDRETNGVPSTKGTKVYQQIPGWHGKCTPGEQFVATNCNQKLIGARFFNAAWGGNAGINAQRPWEYTSARDYNGHGTHTASTSGGNADVPTTGAASVFGPVSGIAPRARIAMYKALWSTQDASTASGFGADLVAAIDQAVADGVDVINYSISGTSTNFADGAEIAFLFAADAGIFVAASAGNSGPTASTVAHPSPWITTVAAGTHDRSGAASVEILGGATFNGVGQYAPAATGLFVEAVSVKAAGVPNLNATQCRLNSLDPALTAGKVVLCDRGFNARVEKSYEVQRAGGVGMVLVNPSTNSLNADLHFVPSVHLQFSDYAAIHAAAAPGTNTATVEGTLVYPADAPYTAGFSSRGPLTAGGGDLLKPDVIAPGNDILAAVSPTGNRGRNFDIYSGTSMSAPHVAGLAALMKDVHPTWSPAAIKSALMTSAYDVLTDTTTDTTAKQIFAQGAGHVLPNAAADPGLVYDNGFLDWLAFLCGTTSAVDPASCSTLVGLGYSLDASDFNGASIAIGNLGGIQTVTRTVTNVGDSIETYEASYTGLAGIIVDISPDTLELNPGESGTFEVTFTTDTATPSIYVGGQLTWSDGDHDVRIPMVIRPVALAAPAQVSGTGDPINYDVTFGYNGPFTATPRGLIPAVTATGTVLDDPTDSTCSLTSPNAQIHTVAVPAGTTYARFSLFDDFTDGADDLDLCVFNAAGTLVGTSGSGTSAEEVNLVNPAAGDYRVVVQGWGTDGPDANYTLFRWLLDSVDAGNMTVAAPATAVVGDTGTINLTFAGLAPATKYLGSVVYGGSTGMPNPTIVRVDTP